MFTAAKLANEAKITKQLSAEDTEKEVSARLMSFAEHVFDNYEHCIHGMAGTEYIKKLEGNNHL